MPSENMPITEAEINFDKIYCACDSKLQILSLEVVLLQASQVIRVWGV